MNPASIIQYIENLFPLFKLKLLAVSWMFSHTDERQWKIDVWWDILSIFCKCKLIELKM